MSAFIYFQAGVRRREQQAADRALDKARDADRTACDYWSLCALEKAETRWERAYGGARPNG